MLRRTVFALFCSTALAPWACSSGAPQCAVGSDCASGVCESTGRCAPLTNPHDDSGVTVLPDGAMILADGAMVAPDGGVVVDESGTADDAPASSDAPVNVIDAGMPLPDGGYCVPNNDGTIVREEVPMLAGLHANFAYAENVTVNSAGVMNANGTYAWDLTGPYSGDHTVLVTTDAPTGQWFSSSFTSATYTTKLADTSTLLGIFQGTSGALQLLGVASPSGGTGQTELTYNPPVDVLALPMKLGSTWNTNNSNVTGMASGLISNYFETYASKVDGQGTLKTPYGTFNVLRVQTTLTRTLAGVPSVIRSFAFVTECFGTIASLTSQTNETTVDFTNAAQVQRLTP